MSPISGLLQTDAYKLDHRRQYPPGTTRVYSNWTNRKSRIEGIDHVVHFGLQAYLQRHLMEQFEPFFGASLREATQLYKKRLVQVLGQDVADAVGTHHIQDLHDLGYIPLRFSALPEGTRVPIRVPSFTVENTHPDFAWLVNYFEPGISAAYWLPSTSATIAYEYRRLLDAAADRTGASRADVDFQAHDFSFRGMSSPDSAAASSAGHLLSFKGTDSLSTLEWIDQYYGGPYDAMSIPATEHSVMSAGTADSSEFETYERLLDLYPTGTLAIVSDTYDLWRVLTEYLPRLKDKIMARDGKLVIRPDSGDPEKILCGTARHRVPFNQATTGTPEELGVVMLLDKVFGRGPETSNGFATLDPHVGVIYGDSITPARAQSITSELHQMGYVSTTATLGVGSFSYQYQTRDTFGSAMKATWAEVNGEGINVFKDPVTDDGTKKSATGRLAVNREHGELVLEEQARDWEEKISLLQPVWEDGKFLKHQSFDEVRKVLSGQ